MPYVPPFVFEKPARYIKGLGYWYILTAFMAIFAGVLILINGLFEKNIIVLLVGVFILVWSIKHVKKVLRLREEVRKK